MISKKVAHLKFDRNTRGVETCTHAKMHKNCSATTNLFALQRYNLNDTGEDSKLVHRRKGPKVDATIFLFFRRVRATSMTQRRVENTRVHFWKFLPV